MSKKGFIPMLHEMAGGDVEAITSAIGKKIKEARFQKADEWEQDIDPSTRQYEDRLTLWFEDGSRLAIHDAGQSCCEDRYMEADLDAVRDLAGTVLRSVSVADAGADDETEQDDDGEYHDVQFLYIYTDKFACVLSTHAIHTGYYGGFSLTAEYKEPNTK